MIQQNIPHPVKEKMRQTEDENMIEVVEDEPEEEPPEIHTTKKEVKKTQLDTLSPTSTVFSAHEPQDTILYPIHEKDYKVDVLIKDYQQYTMYTQHRTAYREDRDVKTSKGNLMIEDTYKEDVLTVTFEEKDVLPMIDNAYMKDMLTVSTVENVMLVDAYKEYVWLAMNENTNQEDVYAVNYMMKNKILIDNGQEETQKTNLMYKRGTEKDEKRLAVSAITSKRGERGA
jgi:hypothetical protein